MGTRGVKRGALRFSAAVFLFFNPDVAARWKSPASSHKGWDIHGGTLPGISSSPLFCNTVDLLMDANGQGGGGMKLRLGM